MKPGFLVAGIREAETRAFESVLPDVLMQRAAAGLATVVLRWFRERQGAYARRVLLVIGPGNNGGDALFAGVRLLARGVKVDAWLAGDTVHEPGLVAFRAAGGACVRHERLRSLLARADLVVDGFAGIGGRPGLPEPVAQLAGWCRELAVPVVAVDLPSGLAPEPPFGGGEHFTAAVTVTFGGYKACHLMEPARSACGRIELVDLGLELPEPDFRAWTLADLARIWPHPGVGDDKYSRGVVGIDTGSSAYPGAAVLSVAGAVGAGAGMVRYQGEPALGRAVLHHFPNVVVAPGRVQAWVLGSGWDPNRNPAWVQKVVESGLPTVLDAGAITQLARVGHAQVVLTPHAGELASLLGGERSQVEADPVTAVREAAQITGCTVLLKGATQYLAEPGGASIHLAVPGPAWTAQAGSGDVLAGICGALLASGLAARDAALAAASIQAITAERHPGPLPPLELARRLVVPGIRGSELVLSGEERTDHGRSC